MRIDGGTWFGWYDVFQDWTTGIDKLEFRNQEASVTSYYDYVAENADAPIFTPQIVII